MATAVITIVTREDDGVDVSLQFDPKFDNRDGHFADNPMSHLYAIKMMNTLQDDIESVETE